MITTIEEIRAIKAAAPVNKDIHDLAEVYVSDGKEACIRRFKEIVEARQLKVWETAVLSNKFRELLINNGILWR